MVTDSAQALCDLHDRDHPGVIAEDFLPDGLMEMPVSVIDIDGHGTGGGDGNRDGTGGEVIILVDLYMGRKCIGFQHVVRIDGGKQDIPLQPHSRDRVLCQLYQLQALCMCEEDDIVPLPVEVKGQGFNPR